VLIHAYSSIDHKLLWSTIQEDPPKLRDQLHRLESGSESDTPD